MMYVFFLVGAYLKYCVNITFKGAATAGFILVRISIALELFPLV